MGGPAPKPETRARWWCRPSPPTSSPPSSPSTAPRRLTISRQPIPASPQGRGQPGACRPVTDMSGALQPRIPRRSTASLHPTPPHPSSTFTHPSTTQLGPLPRCFQGHCGPRVTSSVGSPITWFRVSLLNKRLTQNLRICTCTCTHIATNGGGIQP